MNIRIAMAGLAHGHGTGFLGEAVKMNGVEAVGFWDCENRDAVRSAAERFSAPIFDSLEALLNASGANVLLTAAVNADKADLIVQGIEAGFHIIADKPLVTTVKDLERISEALDRHPEVHLFLMLSERYNPVLVTAKALIDSGEIGEVVHVVAMRPHRLRPEGRPDWMFDSKRYGGILNDIGVHDIDIAVWLADSPVDKILSAGVSNSRYRQYEDFKDNGEALLRLKNGCTAYILESWLTPEKYPHHGEMKFIIHGTKGQITADPQEKTVYYYSDSTPPTYAPIQHRSESYVSDPMKLFANPNHAVAVTTADGIRAQAAALACQAMADSESAEK